MTKYYEFPCFDEYEEMGGPDGCLLNKQNFEIPGECSHLEIGGTWETCDQGRMSFLWESYRKNKKLPVEEGYYMIRNDQGAPLGLVRKDSEGLVWLRPGADESGVYWEEGWTWEAVRGE